MSAYFILPTLAVARFDTVVKAHNGEQGSSALRRGTTIIVPTRAVAAHTLGLMGLSGGAIDQTIDGSEPVRRWGA